ncbi:hypothetical protein VC83_06875 [Pseudogymnoascus destructans]|uniref:Pectinesterase n=1 Tax=Pseudogymnoascus destructans TaxID=655981 RepID=A0A177A2Q7_9PEZI|nr:uncharacterized protein VC83_06875 [Pseudogymnoascus destructans]OAF56387.1 hypothetical protein VC83_06875 [Pseudogymnoascus destructans]
MDAMKLPAKQFGCPKNSILVGHDSSVAKFTSIQKAISSLPDDDTAFIIVVLSGNYTEQLNVTRKAPITIIGQTRTPLEQSENTVFAPNINASFTGSGPTGFPVPVGTPFGNTDSRVYNINFRNIATEIGAGHLWRSGYQDTVYVGKLGNAYFYGNEIAGQTDFLYKFGTAWLERSNLTLRRCGGGIIAWLGTNTTFANQYGCYVSNSLINAANSSSDCWKMLSR